MTFYSLKSEIINTFCFSSTEAYMRHSSIVWLPGNKPRDQLASDSKIRLLIDVITIVQSFNGIKIIVSEIIRGHFLPPPGLWSDPKSPGRIGLTSGSYIQTFYNWMRLQFFQSS